MFRASPACVSIFNFMFSIRLELGVEIVKIQVKVYFKVRIKFKIPTGLQIYISHRFKAALGIELLFGVSDRLGLMCTTVILDL